MSDAPTKMDLDNAANDVWTHIDAAQRCAKRGEAEALHDRPELSEAFVYVGQLHMEIAKFKNELIQSILKDEMP